MTQSTQDNDQVRTPLVCVLAYDGLCMFEFGIAVEVFGLPRPEFDSWYRFCTVAIEPGPLRGTGGVSVEAACGLEALAEADLILVPGWRGADAVVPPELITSLRAAHSSGARIVSICSGVFVLAATGLLDGKRATTHWHHVAALSKLYPRINVDPDVLYIDAGDVLTSAGSAAGLDLCLHVVRGDWGAKRANAVARRLVLPAHRDGGQRQFIQAPVPKTRSGRIAPLLDSIKERLNEDWPVSRMAKAAGLSPRTLARRFKETQNHTPIGWLTASRVSYAVELIETTDITLSEIADVCGFKSGETFRKEFKRLRGVAPSQYRKMFMTSPNI